MNDELQTNCEVENIFYLPSIRGVVSLYLQRELLHKRTTEDSLSVRIGIPGLLLYSEGGGRQQAFEPSGEVAEEKNCVMIVQGGKRFIYLTN